VFDRRWLQDVTPDLERVGPVQPAQVELLSRCVAFINGRIPGNGPLWRVCGKCDECWRAERGERPAQMSARIPYIGPDYADHRIAVVAINSRDNGLPGAEIEATANVIDCLRAGRREYGRGSFFHYWVAATVCRALEGCDVNTQMPAPDVAASSLARSARLQAVQCSPCSTSRRTPTMAMARNCPEFLLRGQLEILAPRVLLLFGRAAHLAIEFPRLDMQWEITWAESGKCFSRGETQLAGKAMTVLAFHHPSYAGWPRSWAAYTASLQAKTSASA
jgi:hypothetical protein